MNIEPKFNRQKTLLALLQSFGGSLRNIDMQKYLFLFTQKCQQEKSYDFVPYKYGCFSFQSYADRRRLIDIGALQPEEDWELDKGRDFLSRLDKQTQAKIEIFHNKYRHVKGNELIREVYLNYPYYAINSEIASKLLTDSEMKRVKDVTPDQDADCFFTIGYEGISFEQYLNKLIGNNVNALVDVRRNPLSRKYGFSKKTLSETTEKLGISYFHMPELGIVSEKRQSLSNEDDYKKLFDEYERSTLKENSEALMALYDILKGRHRVAITCFEAEPCMCHRSRVVKALNELPEWNYPVEHL